MKYSNTYLHYNWVNAFPSLLNGPRLEAALSSQVIVHYKAIWGNGDFLCK